MPPTIQALLAARLDGLGSEERTVIERAAVEGKTFHRGAVMALVAGADAGPGAAIGSPASCAWSWSGRSRPPSPGEEAYRFRHLLIRDAAYKASPSRPDRSSTNGSRVAGAGGADRLVEYGEIIAYHLEQAYRYRTELAPPDALARPSPNGPGRCLPRRASEPIPAMTYQPAWTCWAAPPSSCRPTAPASAAIAAGRSRLRGGRRVPSRANPHGRNRRCGPRRRRRSWCTRQIDPQLRPFIDALHRNVGIPRGG